MSQDAIRSNEPDLSTYWMPFTANRQFKANPRFFVSASGMHYRSADGREILDGTAGLWCVNAGHARPEIAEAVERQLLTLDYSPAFQMGHPGAFELAARLAKMAPEGLDRVFFVNSGSEAVDTALKIALAYHRARGRGHADALHRSGTRLPRRGLRRHVGRRLVNNRRTFGPLLPGVDHLPHTHDLSPQCLFTRASPSTGRSSRTSSKGCRACTVPRRSRL